MKVTGRLGTICIHLFLLAISVRLVSSQQENPGHDSSVSEPVPLGSSVLKYNTEDFRKYVPTATRHHYIHFYAPWCSECKNVERLWAELAFNMHPKPDGEVIIAKVDCTIEIDLCTELFIPEFPTVKFFKRGGYPLGIPYRGKVHLPSMEQFLIDNIGMWIEDKPIKITGAIVSQVVEPEWGLHILFDENFEQAMSNVTRAFVSFCTPWSSKCTELKPVWEAFAKEFRFSEDFLVGVVDCTVNKRTCKKYGVVSYPSFRWIQNGTVVDNFPFSASSYSNLEQYTLKKLGLDKVVPSPYGKVNGPLVISPDEFFEALDKKEMLIVQFETPWCSRCVELTFILEELTVYFGIQTRKKGFKKVPRIATLDCSQYKSTCESDELQVREYPTMNLYKNGKLYDTYNGDDKRESLIAYIQAIIDQENELDSV